MNDTIKLGRLWGVKVGVNWSLFALGGLVAYFLATSRLPADVPGYSHEAYWAAGALTAVALLAGVLVHEAAHAVVALRAKMRVDGITLWFMGGLTRIEGESRNPLTELLIALVGPLASAALGGASLGLSVLAHGAGWQLAAGSLAWLGAINLLLGLFNLVPASPLDGGRVLHGLVWLATKNRWLSTRLTAGAGTLLGALCAVAGLLVFEQGDAVDGVVLAIMGWFVLAAAKREQLAGRAQHVLGDVSISDIMRPAVIAPGWLTVSAFWSEWVKPYPEAGFLLDRWGGDGWAGVVTAQQVAAVPPGMQWSVRAQDIALPLTMPAPPGDRSPLGPGQPALAIAGRAGAALAVQDHGATVGVVLASDVAAMVARGTPVARRTWGGALWPTTPPSSRYA
ncbi:MAG: site-2 protease family protein [Acidimicrobiales bacterium]